MGQFSLTLIGVVLHMKIYPILVNVVYPLIAVDNQVRVSPKAFHNMFRTPKGRLTINLPGFASQPRER